MRCWMALGIVVLIGLPCRLGESATAPNPQTATMDQVQRELDAIASGKIVPQMKTHSESTVDHGNRPPEYRFKGEKEKERRTEQMAASEANPRDETTHGKTEVPERTVRGEVEGTSHLQPQQFACR